LAYHPIGFKKEVDLNIWKNEDMTLTQISKSLFYFVLAGLCEIGGGYLVWLWLREGKNALFALAGSVILIIYGIIPTLQPAHFGRVYAAYGGVFIILSILWGWQIDKIAPDRFDISGGLIALMGVRVIMFWPRG
jgi:small multidrug resistance family-3 protein